jgi:hypothetical protein
VVATEAPELRVRRHQKRRHDRRRSASAVPIAGSPVVGAGENFGANLAN